jgi:hypothetical protein
VAASTTARPTGVAILAVLEIINGIVLVIGGLFAAAFSVLLIPVPVLGAIAGVIGFFALALGIASFLMAWGLLYAKPWAWTITVILTIISLIVDATSANVIGIVISAIVLYYLYRPHVKSYFGKSGQML